MVAAEQVACRSSSRRSAGSRSTTRCCCSIATRVGTRCAIGPETTGLPQLAPRAVQFAITNVCNLACTFCSRDVSDASEWNVDSAVAFRRDLAAAGVLEVAFGGGEPFAFRGFEELVRRLRAETPLAVHATTNGRLLEAEPGDPLRLWR